MVVGKKIWDGSKKEDGSSGCGIVMEAVDGLQSATCLPLSKASTDMPTEVSRANTLTEIIDLIFWHQMNLDTVTQC